MIKKSGLVMILGSLCLSFTGIAGVLETDEAKLKKIALLLDDNPAGQETKIAIDCKGETSRNVKIAIDELCEPNEKVSPSNNTKKFCDVSVSCVRGVFYNKTQYDRAEQPRVAKSRIGTTSFIDSGDLKTEKFSLRLLCAAPENTECAKMTSIQLIACAKEKMTVEASK